MFCLEDILLGFTTHCLTEGDGTPDGEGPIQGISLDRAEISKRT